MKKNLFISILLLSVLLLSSCGGDNAIPMTESEQAEKYGMSVEEFKEQKDAAARMNMTIEDHLKMGNSSDSNEMNHSEMDMGDDTHMIEDDVESHMIEMHDGEEIIEHNSSEHSS